MAFPKKNTPFGIKVKYLVWASLLFLLLVYIVWELYWYYKVGHGFVKWHTHIIFYLGVYLFLSFVASLFSTGNQLRTQTVLFSTTATLIIVESVLIMTGIGETYFERIKYGYSSVYSSKYETYYRLHKPSQEFFIVSPEFTHHRHCNSFGFADIEWEKERNAKKRILFMGDSFTEGVGASQDSCYVSILRTIMDSSEVELMNAGISGNDPVVSYVTYRDILNRFQPDIIVQTLSSNDMNTDIAIKGGLERFVNDSIIVFSPRPWWEPLYAVSYISRLFFSTAGYNQLLLKTPFSSDVIEELNEKANIVFKRYAALAEKENSQLIILLHPDHRELYAKEYEYNLASIAQTINENTPSVCVIDLLPYYLNYFKGRENTIVDYYWKNDGHHNAGGYALMARLVKEAIDSTLAIQSAPKRFF